MAEPEGHALLLALLLNNVNNNPANTTADGATPTAAATVTLKNYISEASYLISNAHRSNVAVITLPSRIRLRSPGLTRPELDEFNRNGYVVLPNILSAHVIKALVQNAQGVMEKILTGGSGIEKHVASDRGERPSPYGRVLATFEQATLSPSSPFAQPIARLGCGIHLLMPPFRALTHSTFHRSLASSLGYNSPRVTQSQIIVKSAHRGSAIASHQDSCISFTNPLTSVTFWYALEDATIENGCLYVARGSHIKEPLRQRCVKAEKGGLRFETLEIPLWHKRATEHEKTQETGTSQIEYEYEPVEVKKGSLVMLDGSLLHRSGRNRSGKSRMAYTFCVIEGDAHCPDDSYLKPIGGEFQPL